MKMNQAIEPDNDETIKDGAEAAWSFARECSDDRAGNINSRIFDHSHLSVVHRNSCVVTRAASEIQSNTRFCYILSRRNLNRVGATFWRRRSDRHGGIHTRPAAAQNTGTNSWIDLGGINADLAFEFLDQVPQIPHPRLVPTGPKSWGPTTRPPPHGKIQGTPQGNPETAGPTPTRTRGRAERNPRNRNVMNPTLTGTDIGFTVGLVQLIKHGDVKTVGERIGGLFG